MKKAIIIVITIMLAGTAGFAQTKHKTAHKRHSATSQKYTCTMTLKL